MSDSRFKVLIAGGGVAGLEALLALRHLIGIRARIEVLAPEREFTYRQLAVAEPFSAGEVARFDLTRLIEDAGGVHRRDVLAGIDAENRVATTAAGEEIDYDAMLIAMGARARPMLPGAITYQGVASNDQVRDAILALDRGEIPSLTFVVPATVRWSLPLYELALLSAAHLAEVGDRGLKIQLVTAEADPLELFGSQAGRSTRALLEEAGIALHAGIAPAKVADGGLTLVNGETIQSGRVIALPAFEVNRIPGVPQGPHGFIGTDAMMRADELDRVFAAGDVTWFPIKQGGLAAQQADTAASAIAALIDPSIEHEPFRPVLRGAMLTGSGPWYLRASVEERGQESRGDAAPLWWPPSKVAGRYLAPYIARFASETNQPSPPLVDLEPARGEAADHREAVELALAAAEADAGCLDYRNALRWLAVAEQLDLTLGAEHALKREEWQRALKHESW